jgi:uncharacterized lipoprotein YddW (UPF0748 family)
MAMLALGACVSPSAPTIVDPAPPAPREFRAAWVATVSNIDWPGKKGLPVEQQKQELIAIVERAKELNLNALIVQVRPAADALYASSIEPWSEYLTGEQGRAPEPFYDPLKMWIDEAHRRGIELHAWFNPYRARHTSATQPLSPTHIANTKPKVVKSYGGYLWMDPAEPDAADQTLNVIVDVVRRYDIDGVHIDDYFYPYPVSAPAPAKPGTELDFPDEPAWQSYVAAGGTLSRADWRRHNVDTLIEKIYRGVHAEKPSVRFGVSPFGIGRPDRRPEGIAGFSQYDKLYADVETWLARGWMDYLVPQLYWPISQKAQDFATLQDYWLRENTQKRHVWIGLFTSKIDNTEKSWKTDEIIDQIALTRSRPEVGGQVHYSMAALMENRRGINDQLKATIYAAPALVPATPWLAGGRSPLPPVVDIQPLTDGSRRLSIELAPPRGESPWLYAVWQRRGGRWDFSVHRADGARAVSLAVSPEGPVPVDMAVISTVDRLGIESERLVVPLKALP